MKRILLISLVAFQYGTAQAQPVSFRVVAATVVRDGQFQAGSSDDKTPADCARFKLGDRAALRCFVKAREVREHDWRERLDWTPCSAAGTLTTADRHTYRWEVDQSGRGQIILSRVVSLFLDGPELPFVGQ